jgi:O-antigen ligase
MFNRYKIYAAYLFAIPLALILGILASSPDELTFVLIGMLLFFLALPLFIKWHHALLILFWNSAFNAFFLPGQPTFWLVLAALSFGLSVLSYVMGRRPFLAVPEMTRPLLFMAMVVVGTACCRGGIGIRSLGGAAHGGRYYVYILGAIMGYFALTAGQIPMLKSRRWASLFFLSGTTFVLSNLAYSLGPGFYFFYYLVPSESASMQAASDYGLTDINRIQGLAPASIAGLCFLLAHYGIRGLFNVAKPWRLAFLCLTVGACFFSGFRSTLALLFLIFAFQFCLEGLLRTRLFPIMVALVIAGFVSLLLFANRMPLAVQRAVAFLPVNVDSEVLANAKGSSEWRFQMWSVAWKDIPKYLVVGKGYSIDPTEMDVTREAIRMGILSSFEESLLAGDYHSGPLSVIIPFGIIGSVAFVWVLIAGFWVLYSNYHYGDAALRRINTVLLAYYLAHCVSFFLIFGALNSELFVFLGICGFSVSLNGGVRRKPMTERGRALLPHAYAMEVG